MRRALLAMAVAASPIVAEADPLRLRGDALATTASPAGLLTLEASGQQTSNLSAEAVVWVAGQPTPGQDTRGDVLVIALKAKDKKGRASGTLGRFVASIGALRPVHVDGAGGRVHLPQRFDVEAYGGVPVVPGLATSRSWDWMFGSRLSRKLGDWGSAGVAYLQQRDDAQIATEEVGFDAGAAFGKADNAAAKLAYDLAGEGVAEVSFMATHKEGSLRTDVFAVHRSPSHILPATSLFSVLGDYASERAGGTLTWKAAPRLDLGADLGARRSGTEMGPLLVGRAKLKLDDRGRSALTGEVRRDGVGADEWTGLRGAARYALTNEFGVATELELVIPDEDRGLGRVWPWALAAVSWDRGDWHAAVAAEASASPTDVRRFDVLGTLGRSWGLK